ncbi:MAG: carboxypeptidase regulatory-like domain-containing protein [Pseudoxanthomonas sp.]
MNLSLSEPLFSPVIPANAGIHLDLVAGLLILVVVLACTRLLWWQRKAPTQSLARGWRLALLLVMQPICAVLLYFTLLPPTAPTEAGTLVVATAQSTAKQLVQQPGDSLIALPEAPAMTGVDRAPDLATALRRHPGTQRLRIVGAGLEARDRDALKGVSLAFEPPELPRGLIRLDPPARVAPGAAFSVGGQAHQLEGGWVELIDPAGQRTDVAALGKVGDFTLQGSARVPGLALFKLRLRDTRRKLLEELDVPVWTAADPAPRLLLLAGAPSPEVKYLRRWATDAGLSLQSQISVGNGVELGDAPMALSAASLQRFDLVILDDRSWSALGGNERAAVLTAVRGGLGVLLRVTGPLSESTRRQWQALGLSVSSGNDSAPLQLPVEEADDEALRAQRGAGTRDGLAVVEGEQTEDAQLTRRVVSINATDATPLLRDDKGTVLATWRTEGRGRIAVWTVTDSFRLALSGQADRYGDLWSQAFATLARPQAGSTPRIDTQPREQRRMVLCNLGDKPRVVAPSGAIITLLPDPATGTSPCAAYWPQQPGWHQLLQTEATVGGDGDREAKETSWPFFVYTTDAAPGLHAAELRDATLRLQSTSSRAAAAEAQSKDHPGRRGPSWPWFLAWLASAAALWWLERARIGRSNGPV